MPKLRSVKIAFILCGLMFGTDVCRAEDALSLLLKKYGLTEKNQPAPSPSAPVPKQPEVKTLNANLDIPKNKESCPSQGPLKKANPHNIQVASFNTEQEANAQIKSLIKMGHQASLQEALVQGKKWHRVLIGAFESCQSAQKYVTTQLTGSLKAAAIIVKMKSKNEVEMKNTLSKFPTNWAVRTAPEQER